MNRFARTLCTSMSMVAVLIALPATAFAAADIVKLTGDATAGNAQAQFELGNAYQKGDGVAVDATSAAKWYLMAAEQGYAQAQVEMALKYAHGEGVPVDHVEAEKWILLASRSANEGAIIRMLEHHFTSDEIQRGHVAAAQWQIQHATPPKPAG